MATKALQSRDEKARHLSDEKEVRLCLDAVIREQVLHALGRPPGLHAVQVRPLWPGRYRVNVLLGADAAAVRVGHSYYLAVGDDGNILSSSPELARLY